MDQIANTDANSLAQAGWILIYFLFNVTLSYYPLVKRPHINIDIEKAPPHPEEISATKERLRHELKTKRDIIVPTLLLTSTPALYYLMTISNAMPLATTLVTAFLMYAIDRFASRYAMNKSLETFEPMPKQYSGQLIDWCRSEKTCDEYRLAVVRQQRDITLLEYEGIGQWTATKKQKEDAERQENKYNELHENKPMT